VRGRWLAVTAVALLALTACSSASDDPSSSAPATSPSATIVDPASWTSADDVIAGLEQARVVCVPEGATPEVVPGLTPDGQPWDALVRVDCQDYSFFLWVDPAEVIASDAASCASFDATFWEEIDARTGVTGDNFAVATQSGEWPEGLPPETFTAAFGGIVESDGAYFDRIGCTRP
jgi:hypothetical protein